MKKKLSIQGIQTRASRSAVELRAEPDAQGSGRAVRGYAALFNSRSENLGCTEWQFYETIAPGAFDGVLNDDVRCLFNHEAELILARSKNGSGTLKIGVDQTGLWYEFDAPETQVGNDLLVSLRRGDIDQSSFSFMVDDSGQSFVESKIGDGPTVIERTITKFSRLLDVSPVTYPAYTETEVDCRALAEAVGKNLPKPTPEVPEHSSGEDPETGYRAAQLGMPYAKP
jgi:HK97 family phage prohead protease